VTDGRFDVVLLERRETSSAVVLGATAALFVAEMLARVRREETCAMSVRVNI